MSAALYLTSVWRRTADAEVEVRTQPYSPDALRRMSGSDPVAIAVGSLDISAPDVWIDVFRGAPLRHAPDAGLQEQWQLMLSPDFRPGAFGTPRAGTLDVMLGTITKLVDTDTASAAMVVETSWRPPHLERLESLLRRVERSRRTRAHDQAANQALEQRNRERLLSARQTLLDAVPTLTSEDLAAGRQSISLNASQLALDLRKSGRIFGLRHGREYRYPAFQFDARGRPRADVARIVASLGKNMNGWDTLQWFIEPNDRLEGHRPIDLLEKSPERLEQAARAAHWAERD